MGEAHGVGTGRYCSTPACLLESLIRNHRSNVNRFLEVKSLHFYELVTVKNIFKYHVG